MNPFSCRRSRHIRATLAGLVPFITVAVLADLPWVVPPSSAETPPPPTASDPAGEELQVQITKKGLGKEVSIKKGNKEWFMMIEVTADNTVVVRQEKENETFLLDESENHDRAMTQGEVDAAIDAFINSVKTRTTRK